MKTIEKMFNDAPWNIKLRVVRNLKNLTLDQVAERLCTKKTIVSGWENGRNMPRAIYQKAICDFYEIPQKTIFG